jgi:hypothetical protein
LYEENEKFYFYRFDQIIELNKIEKRQREQEAKTIANLRQLNIKIIENLTNGFYLAQELKKKKWKQYLCPNYCLDPKLKKHIVNL